MSDTVSHKPSILIIEDEATQRHLLHNQLESQGYQVYSAANGRQGLAIWEAQPDVRMVITDLAMPDMDGVEVVKAVRAREKRYTYLMVLTILDDKECLLRALAAGAGFGACARATGAARAAARSRERETGLRRVKGASFGVVVCSG